MRSIVLAFLCVLLAVPTAFAQSAGYRIQPGDSLAITVLEDDTLNRQVLVLPDGRISVPLAGTISAAGRTVDSVENAIAD
jgi:polysaccharide export outer membrane protein